MTIKGSLQASIPIVKAFFTQNFPSPVDNWPKFAVFGGKWGQKPDLTRSYALLHPNMGKWVGDAVPQSTAF